MHMCVCFLQFTNLISKLFYHRFILPKRYPLNPTNRNGGIEYNFETKQRWKKVFPTCIYQVMKVEYFLSCYNSVILSGKREKKLFTGHLYSRTFCGQVTKDVTCNLMTIPHERCFLFLYSSQIKKSSLNKINGQGNLNATGKGQAEISLTSKTFFKIMIFQMCGFFIF